MLHINHNVSANWILAENRGTFLECIESKLIDHIIYSFDLADRRLESFIQSRYYTPSSGETLLSRILVRQRNEFN